MASVAPTAPATPEDEAALAAADAAPTHRDDTVTWVAGVLLLGVVTLLVATRRGERVRR
jgi:hypothetical protein